MIKIMYVTGTRADYGLMKPTLKEINKHPKLDLSLIVTGMHLSRRYGYTIKEIKKDKFKIVAKVPILTTNDSNANMAISMSKCLAEITKILKKKNPQIVLLEGDRTESLAGAIAATLLNIPIFHLSGGDVSKSIDDSIRHAITKFAHIHLPGTKKSAERIAKMGEEKWRIKIVGTPMNLNYDKKKASKENLKKAFNISFNKPVILVVQHSVTTQSKEVAIQIKKTLMAIRALKKETIIVYPNSDTGGKEMIDIINKHKNLKYLRIVKTIQNDLFMGLLDNISVLVGNSSAGIVEAPFFNLPVVNIGLRQKGRERSGNVIDVNHNSKDIIRAIRKALTKKFRENIKRGKNIYFSKKNVEKKVVDVLLHTKLNEKLLTKEMTY